MRSSVVASLLAVSCLASAVARAGEDPKDEEQARLEAQIARELGAQPAAAPQVGAPSATSSPASIGQGTLGGAGALARLLVLPDISAIGSFAAVHDSYDAANLSPRSGTTGPAGKPTFVFQELELALQAVVDPYVRADVFISFTPGDVAVEEAFVTTLSLPASLQLKAGRFFTPLGRLNGTHPHTWDFLDAPLAHDRLIGNEKLAGPGVDASWLAPLPWFAELHLVAQSTAPYQGEAERLTGTARLAQFFSLSDAATLGLGLSAARRDEGTGASRDLGAVDLFVKYRPPAGRAYLTLQGEAFTRRFRGEPAAGEGGPDGWGAYAQLFWRQDEWWGYGVRWDRAPVASGTAATDPFLPGAERRWSAVGDWFGTEFQRLGLQVSLDQRPGAAAGWEALLHYEFIIGAHGAHPF